jgi:anti-sigma B factor antagonist
MVVDVEQRGDVRIVRVKGPKLTYPVLAPFFEQMRVLIVEGGVSKMLLDLGTVSYMDSASIGCLMDVHRLLREKQGVLKLLALQPRVETMISMTGVLKIIDAYRDEAAALAAFAAPLGG